MELCRDCVLFKEYKLSYITHDDGTVSYEFAHEYCNGREPRLAPDICPQYERRKQ